MNSLKTLLFASLLIPFIACDETNEIETTASLAKEFTIEATSSKRVVYFSFESGDTVVAVTNPKTSNDWDFGCSKYNFITNSGTSGNGIAGVYSTLSTNLDSITSAPETGYTVDDSLMITLSFNPANNTATFGKIAGNYLLSGPMPNPNKPFNDGVKHVWNVTYTSNQPNFEPSKNVFIIKTAKGKYAKIQVLGYYKEGVSGHIKFKYFYQPNGTRDLNSIAYTKTQK